MSPLDDPRSKQADELAQQATRALRAHDPERARRLFAQAAALDEAVASEVEDDGPRVRSVFVVNAVVLWKRAGMPDRAGWFAQQVVRSGKPITDEAMAELSTVLPKGFER